jgi:uncharacterized SAM-binding protein YcdF (DUF218 family)
MIAGWLLSLVGVYVWGHRDTARPVAAIVVMGAAQYAGVRHRCSGRASTTGSISGGAAWPAIDLHWRSGRPRHDERGRVAERYAIDHGVTPRAIMIENAGRSTAESLQHVAALMDAEPSRTVAPVSDPFHMLRLTILARRYGLTAYASPTRTSPIPRAGASRGSTRSANPSRCRRLLLQRRE